MSNSGANTPYERGEITRGAYNKIIKAAEQAKRMVSNGAVYANLTVAIQDLIANGPPEWTHDTVTGRRIAFDAEIDAASAAGGTGRRPPLSLIDPDSEN